MPKNRKKDTGLIKWLKKIVVNQKGKKRQQTHYNSNSQIDSGELKQRAARCYAIAGWDEDACRMFVQLKDDRRAAAYYEKIGQHQHAGECYKRVTDWENAARCFRKCNMKNQTLGFFAKDVDPIQASWFWAHAVHHYQKALAIINQVDSKTESDHVLLQLIKARCDAGLGKHNRSAKQLHKCIAQLESIPPSMKQNLAYEWCIAVGESLNRPDLISLIHATSLSCDRPNAQANWEKWANTLWSEAL